MSKTQLTFENWYSFELVYRIKSKRKISNEKIKYKICNVYLNFQKEKKIVKKKVLNRE